jgi:two-component SAPR family response regulator
VTQGLGGLSILVVEDDFIIGLMLCSEIGGAGGIAIGPLNSVAEALKEIEAQTVDLAILDAKLADGSSADLAAGLSKRRIPYVVVSGYEKANLPTALKGAPFVAKPISMPLLMEAIGSVIAATGPASRAAPERSRSGDAA